jgi:hypothetical protein
MRRMLELELELEETVLLVRSAYTVSTKYGCFQLHVHAEHIIQYPHEQSTSVLICNSHTTQHQ